MCVQWIRHQRSSSGMLSSSHCTGRAPDQATHSSTSRTCSAAWMWIGSRRRRSNERLELVRRHRAQRMRRDAKAGARQPVDVSAARLHQRGEAVEIGEKARLPAARRPSAAAAMGIEARQQRQADAGRRGGGDDARRGLGGIGVARAVGRIVQVVELADRGEARFQHLDVGQRRDRLDVVGGHPRQEAVHHLAPGPEAVVLRTMPLGEAGHGALEGMAVHVRHAGQRRRRRFLRRTRARARRSRRPRSLPSRTEISTSLDHPSSSRALAEMYLRHVCSAARLH